MADISRLKSRLRLPVVGSPMFIVSHPALVIAQCRAGVVGSMPSLNARPAARFDAWLSEIEQALTPLGEAAAPYAINLIAHKSNDRLGPDLEVCVRHRVPIIITSLGARTDVNDAIHSYGGLVFHDVTTVEHARKAIDKGADGLIAVCVGAGGHAGRLSPFALVQEIREWFSGPLILSGAIACGRAVLAAEAMGADFAYVGSAFIATREANATAEYKQAIVDGRAEDIVYTDYFTGVHGNYLRSTVLKAGLDPDNIPRSDPSQMSFKSTGNSAAKVWKDVWGCGQGIGTIHCIEPVQALIDRLKREYDAARQALCGPS